MFTASHRIPSHSHTSPCPALRYIPPSHRTTSHRTPARRIVPHPAMFYCSHPKRTNALSAESSDPILSSRTPPPVTAHLRPASYEETPVRLAKPTSLNIERRRRGRQIPTDESL